jgi:hypothetical protein
MAEVTRATRVGIGRRETRAIAVVREVRQIRGETNRAARFLDARARTLFQRL